MSVAVSEASAAAERRPPWNPHGAERLCTAIGFTLFYVYMLMPARVQQMIAVFRLPAPAAAQAYGVGYPYLTWLDLSMLLLGGMLLAVGRRLRPEPRPNWSLAVYLVLGVACGFAPWIAQAFGFVPSTYWDGPLAALRILAPYLLFTSLPGTSQTRAWHLQTALALLFVSSFLLNLAGFANPATYSNQAGRVSVSGLDFSTASYLGCALALTSLTVFSDARRAVTLSGIGMLGLVLGGSRNAVVFFVAALLLVCVQGFAFRKRLVARFVFTAAIALPLVVVVPAAVEKLPLMRRSLDNPAYYGGGVVLQNAVRATFPLIGRLPVTSPAVAGRLNTWASSVLLLGRQRGWPLGSDWLVQQRLAPLGVPSHSHNGYLQTALKFGPLAVLLWAAWFHAAWSGLRARSPYSAVIVFLLASLLVDYWLLVIKAAFLLFAFIRVNDLWLAEQGRKPHLATA